MRYKMTISAPVVASFLLAVAQESRKKVNNFCGVSGIFGQVLFFTDFRWRCVAGFAKMVSVKGGVHDETLY